MRVFKSKPLILDAFCGAGGAGYGYWLAGFRVVGVDIAPQKNYPFQFIQMDAIEFIRLYGKRFDVIHASPECQKYTRLRRQKKIKESTDARYTDMIGLVRSALISTGKPYIIENVEGAPLIGAVMLCGSMFPELKVYRHRFFESNRFISVPEHYPHKERIPPSGSGVSKNGYVSITSGGVRNLPDGWTSPAAYKNMAMGIDWMIQKELTKAIPPIYTSYLGKQLINYA